MGSSGYPKRPFLLTLLTTLFLLVNSEDPYHFHTWNVKYSTLSPMGVDQQVITINDKFPGPRINGTSNNNIVVNVFNHLDEPLLFTWNGIQQRKNSWMEGTLGTNCPILPGTNMTYKFQVKDQIGSYYYYPTTSLHRSAGGYGPITVHSRELIPVPYDRPEDEFVVLVGDWYSKSHVDLKKLLDTGRSLGRPAGVVINGKSGKGDGKDEPMFTMIPNKTYRYRFCNVGMKNSINVRFQKHSMKLVEVEGSHTVQNTYDSLDVHLGQCYAVLITANQDPKDYYLIASTRFTKEVNTATATIRYAGSKAPPAPEIPASPVGWAWSLNQFRSQRWNLTASAARPNPQGSYHYGQINITRTIKIMNSAAAVDGKLRYGINGVSHIDGETPFKLAQYFGVADKVFKYDIIKDDPGNLPGDKIASVAPIVVNTTYRNFIEIIFENHEKSVQSWHFAGYSFFVVAIEPGTWTPAKRTGYNLIDAVSRNTVQVYPGCWAAIMTTMDNAGLWNLRSSSAERSYLGQQLYFSALSPENSLRDEFNIPDDQLLCGIVKDMPKPKLYTM